MIPQEPRLGGVVLLRAVEKIRICALWIAVQRRTGPDARVKLGSGLIPRRDRHRKVESGFNRAPSSSCQVPGIKADVRAKARVSLVV